MHEYQIYPDDRDGPWAVVYRFAIVERCRTLEEALAYVRSQLGLNDDDGEGGDE